MKHTPTTQDLDILATDIQRDGTTPHTKRVEQVAALAEQARFYPGSVAILRDPHAAPTQAARALLTIRRHWDEILTSAAEWSQFNSSFSALADQWNQHQQLRASGDIAALWQSRSRLDELRVEAAKRSTRC